MFQSLCDVNNMTTYKADHVSFHIFHMGNHWTEHSTGGHHILVLFNFPHLLITQQMNLWNGSNTSIIYCRILKWWMETDHWKSWVVFFGVGSGGGGAIRCKRKEWRLHQGIYI